MNNLDITKFDPTVADLQQLVSITSQITVTDFNDKNQLETVKKNRIALRDARVSITKKGKELREDAITFQKVVLEKERELIAIIEPEEVRLKEIEELSKANKERAERIAILPMRREKMVSQGVVISEEVLVELTDEQFIVLLNQKVGEKNEVVRLENERKDKELKEKEDALKRETETRDREDKARLDERERAENREKERVEREAREKKEVEARAEIERIKKEVADEAERVRLDKRELFITYLKSLGWTEETKDEYLLNHTPTTTIIYKKLGVYNGN